MFGSLSIFKNISLILKISSEKKAGTKLVTNATIDQIYLQNEENHVDREFSGALRFRMQIETKSSIVGRSLAGSRAACT